MVSIRQKLANLLLIINKNVLINFINFYLTYAPNKLISSPKALV